MKIGIVGFSFGLREGHEPNPCNVKLAHEVVRIAREFRAEGVEVLIVVQMEIARALDQLGFHYDLSAEQSADNSSYFSSEDVMAQAETFFRSKGVEEVIPVANPWIHIIKCRKLVAEKFRLCKLRIRWIGFDKKSDQPWCRGPFVLLAYALRQKFFGVKGP